MTANALHPGLVRTHIWEKYGLLSRLLLATYLRRGLTSAEGAQTTVYLVASQEVEKVSGKYFVNCKQVPSSPESYDLESTRRLWEAGERLTSHSGV